MAYPRLAARVRLTAASRPPMRMCPCRAAPRRIELLHERPSPSSDWTARQPHARWVARMTKRPTPTGDGKSASYGGGPTFSGVLQCLGIVPAGRITPATRSTHPVEEVLGGGGSPSLGDYTVHLDRLQASTAAEEVR
jgi:hypothetical protein